MMESVVIVKRGRPRGSLNGQRAKVAWEPKRWKPLYDTVVSLHVAGVTNYGIAKRVHLTPVQVGNIINCVAGQERVTGIKKLALESMKDRNAAKIAEITEAAIDNVHAVITSKMLLEKAPFKLFDRSVRALQGAGIMKPGDNENGVVNNTQNNNFFVTPEGAARVIDGLGKVERVLAKAIPAKIEVKSA